MQTSSETITIPAIRRLSPKRSGYGDVDSLQQLKKIARACLYNQFGASFIFFFSSLLFPESKTAALMCGILAILVSLTPIVYTYINKCFVLAFSCVSVFNMAPVWFLYLEAILPGYDANVYSPPVYIMEMFFWVAVFHVFVNMFYLLFWKRVSAFSIKSFTFLETLRIRPEVYGILALLAFLIPLIGFYYYYNSTEKLWIHFTAGRSEEGIALKEESVNSAMGAFLKPLTWLLQLTPLFGAINVVSSKNKLGILPVLSVLLISITIFIFFLGGSRGTMMFVAAPVFFFLVYYNWHRGLKFWIPAIASLFLVIAVMEIQLRFRGNLLEVIVNPEKALKENHLQSVTTFDPSESHRDNNTYLFCLILKGYPDKYSFKGFDGLIASLVNPIPRAVWPSKPMLSGAKDISTQPRFILDGPLYMGTTSLTFSVVGDAYQAKGVLGLFVYAFIYGLFISFFDGVVYYTRKKQALAAGLLGVGVFLSFWGYRSFFALITFLYPVLLLLLAIYLVQLVRKVF